MGGDQQEQAGEERHPAWKHLQPEACGGPGPGVVGRVRVVEIRTDEGDQRAPGAQQYQAESGQRTPARGVTVLRTTSIREPVGTSRCCHLRLPPSTCGAILSLQRGLPGAAEPTPPARLIADHAALPACSRKDAKPPSTLAWRRPLVTTGSSPVRSTRRPAASRAEISWASSERAMGAIPPTRR